MNKINLPNNLYELRRKAGLSQEEFADKLCVSRQAVSKWERGEAYPDTENLIAISAMFSVTIDELLHAPDLSHSSTENKGGRTDGEIPRTENESSCKGGFGLKLALDNGIDIKIGNGDQADFTDGGVDDSEDEDADQRRNWKYAALYSVPYSILCLVSFLVLGFTRNAWDWAWTLFLTIPVYDSILDAIRKKSLGEFAYAIFIAFLYCLLGTLCNWWHPGWVIFITIPVYYYVAESIDKYIQNRKR